MRKQVIALGLAAAVIGMGLLSGCGGEGSGPKVKPPIVPGQANTASSVNANNARSVSAAAAAVKPAAPKSNYNTHSTVTVTHTHTR